MRRLVLGVFFCASTAGAQTPEPAPAQPPPPAPAEAPAPAAPAADTVLKLKDGAVLVGNVVSQTETAVVFRLLTLGEVTVPMEAIAAREAVGAPPAAAGMNPMFAVLASGKPIYLRSLTLGGQFTSAPFIQGVLDPAIPSLTGALLNLPGKQYGIQGSGAIYRYTMKDAMSVEVGYTYAKADPIGPQADMLTTDFGYNRRLGSDRRYLITRSSYKRDKVREIDYSLVQLAGVGFKLVDNAKTKFDVAPGVVIVKEDKGSEFDGDVLFGVGGMETLTHNVNASFILEQRALYRVVANHTEVWALDAYAGVKGMLNPKVGITIGASYIYDNTLGDRTTPVPANALFPGSPALNLLANEKGQLVMTAGVQVKF